MLTKKFTFMCFMLPFILILNNLIPEFGASTVLGLILLISGLRYTIYASSLWFMANINVFYNVIFNFAPYVLSATSKTMIILSRHNSTPPLFVNPYTLLILTISMFAFMVYVSKYEFKKLFKSHLKVIILKCR